LVVVAVLFIVIELVVLEHFVVGELVFIVSVVFGFVVGHDPEVVVLGDSLLPRHGSLSVSRPRVTTSRTPASPCSPRIRCVVPPCDARPSPKASAVYGAPPTRQ